MALIHAVEQWCWAGSMESRWGRRFLGWSLNEKTRSQSGSPWIRSATPARQSYTVLTGQLSHRVRLMNIQSSYVVDKWTKVQCSARNVGINIRCRVHLKHIDGTSEPDPSRKIHLMVISKYTLRYLPYDQWSACTVMCLMYLCPEFVMLKLQVWWSALLAVPWSSWRYMSPWTPTQRTAVCVCSMIAFPVSQRNTEMRVVQKVPSPQKSTFGKKVVQCHRDKWKCLHSDRQVFWS